MIRKEHLIPVNQFRTKQNAGTFKGAGRQKIKIKCLSLFFPFFKIYYGIDLFPVPRL